MIFGNTYIKFNKNLNIYSISSYKKIMIKFINRYIDLYKIEYVNKEDELYSDAIIYSKYYLYYKTQNCIYKQEIMDIFNNIDLLNN